MSFRLVQKSVTMNGVMAVTLRYFTEFGKPVFRHRIPLAISRSKTVRCALKQRYRLTKLLIRPCDVHS